MTAKELNFLDFSRKTPPVKWTPVKVAFIGGENYVLITVDAEVRIDFVPGGFETKFKEPFAIRSELLLGSSFRKTKLFDIELRLPGFTMSMARMKPEKFPRVVAAGEVVGING